VDPADQDLDRAERAAGASGVAVDSAADRVVAAVECGNACRLRARRSATEDVADNLS
jgi:hypothetical protein